MTYIIVASVAILAWFAGFVAGAHYVRASIMEMIARMQAEMLLAELEDEGA